MFERTVEYYRLINRPGKPEDSVAFRVAVLVTVLIAVFAAVKYGAVGALTGALVIAGVIAGSVFSYYARNKTNLILKLILSVLLLLVFIIFLAALGGAIQDLRYPLVRLFLWVLVLHSFDLPTRRDLDFSLASSAILIAFAGTLSISSNFLYMLVPFFASGLITLYIGHRSSLMETSDVFVPAQKRTRTGWAFVLAAIALVPIGLLMFMFLPRLPGFNSYYLPMSKTQNVPAAFGPLLKNPGYKDLTSFPDTPLPFNPDGYYGFNNFLDLRVRGVPPDRTVMKVRSTRPEYWRASAFDKFLGNGWENSEKNREDIFGELPLTVTDPPEPVRYGTTELVQTFFVERRLPNTIFAAYAPRSIYFPVKALKQDTMSSVLAPVTLDPGLIYSVVSEVSNANTDMLRYASSLYPKNINERYTQLPAMSPAVGDLARNVTSGKTDEYDKVDTICNYLRNTYTYDLKVKPQGNQENSAEFFLFKTKRGYCEHFSTAMAVMCRTLGIPARVAVGYATGQYNALTGYYEVSSRDAHAWVEVYFPTFGWISFDPTPGSADPQALEQSSTTWNGLTILQGIGKALKKVFPASWGRVLKSAASALGRGVKSAAGAVIDFAASAWPWILALLALALIAFALSRRRTRRARSPGPVESDDGPRQRAARAFERMSAALASAGIVRAPAQTALEFAGVADSALGFDLGGRAARLFNALRFGSEPREGDLAELDKVVDGIEAEVSGRKKPRAS